MTAMALRGVRGTANRGGRPSKGARHQRTIRFPADLDAKLEPGADNAGFDNVNDYVVALVTLAVEAGLTPAAPPQDRLPLTA